MQLTFDQALAYVVFRHPGQHIQARDKISVCCVLHKEKHASFTWFLTNGGGFNCHGCGAKGNLLQFETLFSSCSIGQAKINIQKITGAGLNGSGGEWVAEYIYFNREGIPVAKKDRFEKPGDKYFKWSHYDEAGRWRIGLTDDTPRLLYNQHEITTANFIIQTEGEKCAEAVKELAPRLWPERQAKGLRIAVTTNPEGAWQPKAKPKWRTEYNKSYSDKELVFFEDNDASGITLADYVSAQACPFAASVRRVAFPDKRPGYDIADWIREHHPETLIADLERLIESAPLWKPAAQATENEKNVPVAGQVWPVLPAAALYGLAGDVVRAIEPHSEADPTAILIQFLVMVGNVIGAGLHCVVESTRHALSLYTVLVGETSKGRKGTSWGHIERLCVLVDAKWAMDRVTGGLSSAEGLIAEMRDDRDPSTDRRLMIIESEFAAVLRVMSREGNNLSPRLRSAFDNGTMRIMTKHDPLKATGVQLSMVGHITRLELLRYLSDTEAHNGFANRFLWSAIKRSKCLPEGGSVPEKDIADLARRLRDVVDWAGKKGEVEIRRNDPARELWATVYPKLSEGLPGLLGAATSRAEALVLRLSAVYAVLDRSTIIRIEHLQAALAVWDYCFASARYIFGDATGDPVADRIREALDGAGEGGLTRTQIRDLLGRHSSADRIGQALAQLLALGIATCRTEATEGRSIELWIATKAT